MDRSTWGWNSISRVQNLDCVALCTRSHKRWSSILKSCSKHHLLTIHIHTHIVYTHSFADDKQQSFAILSNHFVGIQYQHHNTLLCHCHCCAENVYCVTSFSRILKVENMNFAIYLWRWKRIQEGPSWSRTTEKIILEDL